MEEEPGVVRSMSEGERVDWFKQVSSMDFGFRSVELVVLVVARRDVGGVKQVSSMSLGLRFVEVVEGGAGELEGGGARGCCCREEEKWNQDGYHGNELHKQKKSSLLPTLSRYV